MNEIFKSFQQKIKSNLFKNFSYLFILQIVNYVFPFLTLPYISRVIEPDLFGIMNYAGAYLAYFTLLVNYGFEYSSTREISRNYGDKEKIDSIYWDTIYSKFLLFFICLIAILLVFDFDSKIQNYYSLSLAIFINIVSVVIYPTWMFQGMSEMKVITIFTFLSKLVFLPIVFLLLKTKEDFIMVNLLNSILQIVISIIAFSYAIKKYNILFIKPSLKNIFITFKQGFSNFFSWVAISMYTTVNILILGQYISNTALGYYSSASKLISVIIQLLLFPVSIVLFPFISSKINNSPKEAILFINKVALWGSIILLIACTGVFFMSEILVELIFGKGFLCASIYLKYMAIIPILIFISNMYGVQGVLNFKEDKTFLIVTSCAAIISISLNLILVPRYFELGTIISWIFTEIFVSFTMFMLFYWKLHKKYVI